MEQSLTSPAQRFLPTAMRVYGLCFALAPASFYWLPAAGRWEPFNVSYERMFTVLFFAWGLCLFWAADAPAENRAIVKIVNRDLAGIGSGKNSPRSVPILERLSSGRFKLRTEGL